MVFLTKRRRKVLASRVVFPFFFVSFSVNYSGIDRSFCLDHFSKVVHCRSAWFRLSVWWHWVSFETAPPTWSYNNLKNHRVWRQTVVLMEKMEISKSETFQDGFASQKRPRPDPEGPTWALMCSYGFISGPYGPTYQVRALWILLSFRLLSASWHRSWSKLSHIICSSLGVLDLLSCGNILHSDECLLRMERTHCVHM